MVRGDSRQSITVAMRASLLSTAEITELLDRNLDILHDVRRDDDSS